MVDKRKSQKTSDRVSVVIPVRNCRDLIDVQLEAIAAQSYKGELEVIVSDNGSTDGLAQHIHEHPLRDELRIVYVDSSARQGPAHARNEGAKCASGNFLAFCDADDRVHPDWIARLRELAEEFDVVGGCVRNAFVELAQDSKLGPLSLARRAGESFHALYGRRQSRVPRRGFRALGGMNEDLRGSEDVDFVWRAQLEGYSFGFLREALVGVRLRQTGRDLWKQGRALGYGSAQLLSLHRGVGAPGIALTTFLRHLAVLVVQNPLLPVMLTRMPRARWGLLLAVDLGMLHGGIKFKVLTLW